MEVTRIMILIAQTKEQQVAGITNSKPQLVPERLHDPHCSCKQVLKSVSQQVALFGHQHHSNPCCRRACQPVFGIEPTLPNGDIQEDHPIS